MHLLWWSGDLMTWLTLLHHSLLFWEHILWRTQVAFQFLDFLLHFLVAKVSTHVCCQGVAVNCIPFALPHCYKEDKHVFALPSLIKLPSLCNNFSWMFFSAASINITCYNHSTRVPLLETAIWYSDAVQGIRTRHLQCADNKIKIHCE